MDHPYVWDNSSHRHVHWATQPATQGRAPTPDSCFDPVSLPFDSSEQVPLCGSPEPRIHHLVHLAQKIPDQSRQEHHPQKGDHKQDSLHQRADRPLHIDPIVQVLRPGTHGEGREKSGAQTTVGPSSPAGTLQLERVSSQEVTLETLGEASPTEDTGTTGTSIYNLSRTRSSSSNLPSCR